MLIKYIRDKDNNPRGCVLALGRDMLSWSLCGKEDKFSKSTAKKIAMERFHDHYDDEEQLLDAEYWRSIIIDEVLCFRGKLQNMNFLQNDIIQTLFEQEERAIKYFKEDDIA